MMRGISVFWLAAFGALATVSCGAGAAGKAVRPTDPTANDALSKSTDCKGLSDEPQLLTLDWDDSLRIDLETTMNKGVVVVKYDCNGFKVLRDCQVPGAYEFAGFSPAKTVAKIADEDQLHANLPVGAVSLTSEMKRGSTIDIVYMAVGQKATTVHDVPQSKLSGKCEGATHTVRTANVGAFAMTTGAKGEVNAAVQIMSKGGGGSSSSDKKIEHVNGLLDACEKASDSATEPTEKCKALVQLLLSPVVGQPKAQTTDSVAAGGTDAKERDARAKNAAPDALKERCPTGFAADKTGLCAKKDANNAGVCEIANFDGCKGQCDKGDMQSCFNAGANRMSSSLNKTSYKESYGRYNDAFPFMDKACTGGLPAACGQLGFLYQWGYGTKKDHDKGEQLLVKGCSGGDPWACRFLAGQYRYGANGFKRDQALFFTYNKRGCSLGDQHACVEAAIALIEGTGVAKDMNAAVALLGKACDAGDEGICKRANNLKGDVSSHAASGEKVKVADTHARFGPDPIDNPCAQGLRPGADGTCVKPDAGVKFTCDPSDFEECKKSCDAGDGKNCLQAAANRLGKWNKDSKTGREDAYALIEKSCAAGYAPGCGEQGNALHFGKGVKENRDRSLGFYEKGCTGGDIASCDFLGHNEACSSATCNGVKKDLDKGIANLGKACDLGHAQSCRDVANILENGSHGSKKDPKAAIPWLDKGCKLNDTSACDRSKKLSGKK